jgi:hypothetical protein
MTSTDYDSFFGRAAFRTQLLIELEATREAARLINATFSALNPLSALNLALFGLMYYFFHTYIMLPDPQGIIDSRRCALYAIVPSIALSVQFTRTLPTPWLPTLL